MCTAFSAFTVFANNEQPMTRSRKRKKKTPSIFPKLLVLIAAAGLMYLGVTRSLGGDLLGSSEQKELSEWLEVSGDKVRIYLDNEADFNETALYESGKLYLPVDYVRKKVNTRFFWSDADRMLSLTLAEETLDITESDERDGAPAIIERDGVVYVQADIIEAYSHVVITAFCDEAEPAKRVFIDISGSTVMQAEVKHGTAIRTKRELKSPQLVKLNKGETVKVTEYGDSWCSVVSAGGYSGFVRTKMLTAPEETVTADNYTEPVIQHTLLTEQPVMAWHGVYGNAGNNELDRYLQTAGSYINVISPTWIQIKDGDGNYVNYSSREYIAKAHAAGCKVWVCVDNFNQSQAVSDFDTKAFFDSAEQRRGFIDKLMAEAESYGYDGFNLDFEGIRSEAGESYAQFFRELSVECRKAGLTLSIDNHVPYDFNNFYRIDEQGAFADYVVVMLYDEHTTEPGSNASLPYVEYGLDKCAKNVPTKRTIAALPLYTRLWSTSIDGSSSSETLSLSAAEKFVNDNAVELNWDEGAGQYYGELKSGDKTRKLWLEDSDSLSAKMDAVRERNTGGIAVWRLGYDTADIWEILYSGYTAPHT